MRLVQLEGRATLVIESVAVDVATATEGRFGPDIAAVYEHWEAFCAEVSPLVVGDEPVPEAARRAVDDSLLGPPSPAPRQVFAIGLNYREHAAESGRPLPEKPATFTKYPSAIAGPFADVALPAETVDWEVELVVVIGTGGRDITREDAWSRVAGLTVGQDFSERTLQFQAGAQFSLGKSFAGFGPIGPAVVTPDEFVDRNDLGLTCTVDGEVMQSGRTSDLIFDVPTLLEELSRVVELYPGDLIFTGTPSGVGVARDPARFLRPGNVVESTIEGIGTIRNRMV